jgi:hypothetical protein
MYEFKEPISRSTVVESLVVLCRLKTAFPRTKAKHIKMDSKNKQLSLFRILLYNSTLSFVANYYILSKLYAFVD